MRIERHFPGVISDAETASAGGQTAYVRWTLAGLLLACVAAVGGAVDFDVLAGDKQIDLGGLVAALAFAAAIGLSTYVLSTKPQQRWYEGRALAESVKTLAWQYSVAGGPFRLDAAIPATDLFARRLGEILREMTAVRVTTTGGSRVTDQMRELREQPLAARAALYLEQRVDDQVAWYSRKTADNERGVHRWFAVVVIAQSVGVVAGAFKAFDVVDIDVLGILAALAASAAAWLQTKDHQHLAQSYAVTARELHIIHNRATGTDDVTASEHAWADFVEEAERAISREHTLWLARRTA